MKYLILINIKCVGVCISIHIDRISVENFLPDVGDIYRNLRDKRPWIVR